MDVVDPLDKQLRALRTIQWKDHLQLNDDGTGYRISSAAFRPGGDGTVSVDLEETLRRAGLPLNVRYPSLPRSVALVAHKILEYEANSYVVRHDPLPDNEHHGVAASSLRNNPLRSAARKMAETVQFVVPINVDDAVKFGAPAPRPSM